MGTRADFYVGRGATAEWIGSVSMDGYPEGINHGGGIERAVETSPVLSAKTEEAYRAAVFAFLTHRKRWATLPEAGWPWPWEDSRTTDYAYAFDGGQVWGSNWGYAWFKADAPQPDEDEKEAEDEKVAVFPQFTKDRMAPPGTDRSGIMIFGA